MQKQGPGYKIYFPSQPHFPLEAGTKLGWVRRGGKVLWAGDGRAGSPAGMGQAQQCPQRGRGARVGFLPLLLGRKLLCHHQQLKIGCRSQPRANRAPGTEPCCPSHSKAAVGQIPQLHTARTHQPAATQGKPGTDHRAAQRNPKASQCGCGESCRCRGQPDTQSKAEEPKGLSTALPHTLLPGPAQRDTA